MQKKSGKQENVKRRKSPGPVRKIRGERAEAAFMAKALSLGLRVCRPWGDTAPFDFVVECEAALFRVQVKSCWAKGKNQYQVRTVSARRDALQYRKSEVDFLVAYVAPEEMWYVIPAGELPAQQNAMLYSHVQRSRGKFEKYREAWELFWSAARAKKRRYKPEIGVPPAVEKVASQARLRRAWMELGEWLVSRQ